MAAAAAISAAGAAANTGMKNRNTLLTTHMTNRTARDVAKINQQTAKDVANIRNEGQMNLQRGRQDFIVNSYNEATKQLNQVGLPSYVLFTGGKMPNQGTYTSSSGLITTPFGAPSFAKPGNF